MMVIHHIRGADVVPVSTGSERTTPLRANTSDMVFAVQQLQEKCHEQNQSVVYIDLIKAFNTVNDNGLWKILCRFGCPEKLVLLSESFHGGMQGRVQGNGEISEPFPVRNGVKQRSVLAPTLFSILFAAMSTDAFRNFNPEVCIEFRSDSKLFKL